MMESLLIANRGEIARRIIRTARRLGVRTVAVYSEADRLMPFVCEADESVAIGPAPARDSYLRVDRILAAARETGAAAIHPGYGFLSENAEFAEAVEAAGLVWVGPPPMAIRVMGQKGGARFQMMAAGVPLAPGYSGSNQDDAYLALQARRIGYPSMIKAERGGGGKGMRRVASEAEFPDALATCRREAEAAFGDARVMMERYIPNPRHIEVQVFADRHGGVVHLFERDCSLQRRHQKVIEEAPAPGMDAQTREAVCRAAVAAARAVRYVGAGTVEFVADASEGLRADRIWFIEMNTRLQVEHPVTEAITGVDLVEWQLRVAAGEPLPKRQEELRIEGWAIEARLYAENPRTGFLPSTGRLSHLSLPRTCHVDSGVEEGCEITSHYDPMIAKLVAHGATRRGATRRLAESAAAVEVAPVRTNAGFLVRALRHPDFLGERIDTGFIERHGEALLPPADPGEAVLHRAAASLLPESGGDAWSALAGFRINAAPSREVAVDVAGRTHLVTLPPEATFRRTAGGYVFHEGEAWRVAVPRAEGGRGQAGSADGAILASMPGTVTQVRVAEGERVRRGQALAVIEAMKMEQVLAAPFDGVVAELRAAPGRTVEEGTVLLRVRKDD